MPNTQMFLEGAQQLGSLYLTKIGLSEDATIYGAAERISEDEFLYYSNNDLVVILDAVSVMWYARNVIGKEEAFKGCRLRGKEEEYVDLELFA